MEIELDVVAEHAKYLLIKYADDDISASDMVVLDSRHRHWVNAVKLSIKYKENLYLFDYNLNIGLVEIRTVNYNSHETIGMFTAAFSYSELF